MATLAVTWTAGQEAGAQMRKLASVIEQAALNVGDSVTGASVTLTFDNAPSTGHVSVLVAGGGLATQTTYLV
jgi:hypothetical protein